MAAQAPGSGAGGLPLAAPFMHLVATVDLGLAPLDRNMHDAVADHRGVGGKLFRRRLALSGGVEAQYRANVHRRS